MMRSRRATLVLTAVIAVAPVLFACGPAAGSPRAATMWLDDKALTLAGFGRVAFRARDGHDLEAHIYRPRAFDPAGGPIWFVLHGASRDVERYVRAAAPVAERYGALVVAPYFSKQAYPRESDYTLGVMQAGRWRDPGGYLYAEIEHLFDAVRGSIGGRQTGYYLFGHSAGAQFVHRLLTFLPAARALGGVAANAGWYTLPAQRDPRFETFPYGLIGAPIAQRDLRRFFATPFVVLLGERDTTTADEDELVRGTPEAQAQGSTRLARGRHYFATAKETASELGVPFRWRLEIVPRAAHDAGRVIASAGFLLFDPEPSPCVPTAAADASGLTITEILADPPSGTAGDANGDGDRDPSGDEFIEIVNAGREPVCLSGWTLGDVKDAERHVFPLGRALPAGGVLVVFGGGVPTGRFGGAEVQRAAAGLGLANAGDVLTLRDGTDTIARRVSWGNCGGAPCADDHWPGALDIAGSIARRPAPGSRWTSHTAIDGSRFSPGVVAADAGR